jgi:predicted transcriptional regulator
MASVAARWDQRLMAIKEIAESVARTEPTKVQKEVSR